ncbi:hypothetical protein [Methylosinus sp. PW1]|uniref:hypothetical protein n=1 Tax=Methylosinus sp. PW1 TaxID=107636 RepID=UPI000A6295C7|nr:hypothetical protein [Methylosinus sp. PW1]
MAARLTRERPGKARVAAATENARALMKKAGFAEKPVPALSELAQIDFTFMNS